MTSTQNFTPSDILVVYHKYCRDGYASAMVIDMWHSERPSCETISFMGADPSCIEAKVDEIMKFYPESTKVFVVDLAMTYTALSKLVQHFSLVTVIDHHATTIDKCVKPLAEGMPNTLMTKALIFDQAYCGATLTFKHFYQNPDMPGGDASTDMPVFLKYIQDRDLWKETQPDSKAINCGLFETLSMKFACPLELSPKDAQLRRVLCAPGETKVPVFNEWIQYTHSTDWIPRMKNLGEITQACFDKISQGIANRARLVDINVLGKSYKVYIVNSDTFVSDVSNILYTRVDKITGLPICDLVMIWRYSHVDEKVYVSLRSAENGANVKDIATAFASNGGGHVHAAGFECSITRITEILTLK